MAEPVITTRLNVNPATGSLTTTGGEDVFASSAAAAGSYVLVLDRVNQQDGDVLEMRGYTSADGSNQRVCWVYSLSNSVPAGSDQIHVTPPIITANYVKFTVTRIAGGDRAYPWSILNTYGL